MQRWAVAVGAAGVAVGRAGGLPHAVVDTAGSLYLAGLVGLAVLLVRTARRGVERRFDPAVAAYLAALAAGLAGVAIGIAMAAGSPTPQLRATHATVNLLGLVGLVVSGTLPFFAATVGRSRMSPRATRARLAAALVWQVATLAVGAAGLAADSGTVGAIGLVAYALGVLLTLDSVPRPTRRQLNWAGPRLVGLWAGTVWWAVAVAATAVDAAAGRPVLSGRWLLVLVIAGYGQVLWGSLAYLLPMLRGGGHRRLGEGFGVTRSWPGLAAVNVAGACLATALSDALAAAAVAVWAVDAAWRAARVGTTRAQRPDPEEGHAVTT
jgi:nitrite reductase (NO-forming)